MVCWAGALVPSGRPLEDSGAGMYRRRPRTASCGHPRPPRRSLTATLREQYADVRATPPAESARPMSRQSVAESLGLSRETVRRKIAALIERGCLIEDVRGGVIASRGVLDDKNSWAPRRGSRAMSANSDRTCVTKSERQRAETRPALGTPPRALAQQPPR
jgi:biotin operon repressor